MRRLFLFMAPFVAVYFVAAFINWQWDVTEWGAFGRFMYVSTSAWLGVSAVMLFAPLR
jgi:hypothetical protein